MFDFDLPNAAPEPDRTPLEAARVSLVPMPAAVLYLPGEVALIPGLIDVPILERRVGVEWIYLLCHEGPSPPGHPPRLVVEYVGRAPSLGRRGHEHASDPKRRPFSRLLTAAVLSHEAGAVEAALIRLLEPPGQAVRRAGRSGEVLPGRPLRPQDVAALRAWGFPVERLGLP